MKYASIALLFLVGFISSAFASDEEDALAAVQKFYDGYMKVVTANGDSEKWVLASDAVTAGFKKTYKAFMKDADYDPILNAQDYPDKGFEAAKAALKGAAGTVTMKSRDSGFDHTIKVFVAKQGDVWLINGVEDLKGK